MVAVGAASLLNAIGCAALQCEEVAMVRYGLIGFAAAILVAASLAPGDAFARRGGGTTSTAIGSARVILMDIGN